MGTEGVERDCRAVGEEEEEEGRERESEARGWTPLMTSRLIISRHGLWDNSAVNAT